MRNINVIKVIVNRPQCTECLSNTAKYRVVATKNLQNQNTKFMFRTCMISQKVNFLFVIRLHPYFFSSFKGVQKHNGQIIIYYL